MKQPQRSVIVQAPRKQDGRSNLIELQSRPIGTAINPAVLRKTAVRPLNRRQPDQSAQRRAGLASGEERDRAVHKIARPHEVIATEILVSLDFAPWNAHRGDDCALKNFVLMPQQHAPAQPINSAAVRCITAKIEFRIDNCTLPLANVRFAL